MPEITLKPAWQDIIIDPGLRPNLMIRFSNGIVTGMAVNSKIFEAIFVWPAVAAGDKVDFFLAQLQTTAAGLSDIFRIKGPSDIGVQPGNVVLMEVLRGESVPNGRFFKRIPLNEIQAIHPNSNVGRAKSEMDQIFGWDYPGYESPFTNPTAVSRLIIGEDVRVEVGMRNESTFAVTNTSRIIFNTFEFRPNDPEVAEDRERIAGIIKGRIPKLTWSPGLARADIADFPKSFGTKPVNIKKGQIVFGPSEEVLG